MDDILPVGRLALLLFTLMGPIGLTSAFDNVMRGRDVAHRRKVAPQLNVFTIVALGLAVFLGPRSWRGSARRRDRSSSRPG